MQKKEPENTLAFLFSTEKYYNITAKKLWHLLENTHTSKAENTYLNGLI